MFGVWERLVQITKKHLKSAAGDGLLSDVELRTLLAEVESIVNREFKQIATVGANTAAGSKFPPK